MTGPQQGDEAQAGLPDSLAARPRDPKRHLPIPPVNLHPDPSTRAPVVDFTTVNTTTATSLAINRRCSLCGRPMEYWVKRAKSVGATPPRGRCLEGCR
jgi:hypothetical protein